MHRIYLDYNATTPLDPNVFEAMLPYLREHYGNPSSGHWFGAQAKAAVEHAREQVAALLGTDRRRSSSPAVAVSPTIGLSGASLRPTGIKGTISSPPGSSIRRYLTPVVTWKARGSG